MAITRLGDRLTAEHRIAQKRIATASVQRARTLIPLLDPRNPGQAWVPFTEAWSGIVRQGRQASADTASVYYTRFRKAEGGGLFTPAEMADLPDLEVESMLHQTLLPSRNVTLSPAIERIMDAKREALTLARTADMVGEAGNQVILDTVEADPEATTWARVPSASACAFCLMLASRGPVYKSVDSAEFEPHDKCDCKPEPVMEYGKWKGAATVDQAKALYDEAGGDVNMMRRILEGRE